MAEKAKILLINDSIADREWMETILKGEGFEVFTSSGGNQTISLAKGVSPDLILLEVGLPDQNGYQVCKDLRSHKELSRIPIVLLSSEEALDKTESLECGADDYIIAPLSENELIVRVKMNLKRYLEDRSVSSLTGLPGSSAIDEEIKKRVMNRGEKFSILFIDIDNFKAFNHAYGFLRGDEVIKLVARIAAEAISQVGERDDFLGHDGGDDFVLITTPENATVLGSKIIDEFDRGILDFYRLDDLSRGFVVTQTRQGAVLKHPIMTVSVSVVSNEKREIATHWEVRDIGKEIKEYAKNAVGSGYYPDRRTK